MTKIDPNILDRFHELRETFEEDLVRLMTDADTKGIPLDIILFGLHEAELVTEWHIKNQGKGDDRFIKKVKNMSKEYADRTIEMLQKKDKKRPLIKRNE